MEASSRPVLPKGLFIFIIERNPFFLRHILKKSILVCVLLLSAFSAVFAQITTASNYFQTISEYYATVKSYEADIKITTGTSSLDGRVSFKSPNLLRIDFSNPESQVIVYDGSQLTIYLPNADATLIQATDSDDSAAGGASLATPQGLYLMNRYYHIAYLVGQNPVPLAEGSSENVVKLVLTRKNNSESFKTINLAISPVSRLIRQISAELASTGETFTFTFSNYDLNTTIPATRFIYEAPSSSNNYTNFVYTE